MSSGEGALCDVEGLCRWAYERCLLDPHRPPTAPDLAEALLGAGSIWSVPASWLVGRAKLTSWPVRHWPGAGGLQTAEWYIQVKRRLDEVNYTWALAHELAEWLLRHVERYIGEDIERMANALAAALLVPRSYVLAHSARLFEADVARTFCVTPSCLALRWAEVTGEAVAVVSPNSVHRRGPDGIWPVDDQALRWLARYDDAAATCGARRVRRVDLGVKRTAILLV